MHPAWDGGLIDHCPDTERLRNLTPDRNGSMRILTCEHHAQDFVLIRQTVTRGRVHLADLKQRNSGSAMMLIMSKRAE